MAMEGIGSERSDRRYFGESIIETEALICEAAGVV